MAISEWRVDKLEMEVHTLKLQVEALSVVLAEKLYGIKDGCEVKDENNRLGIVIKLAPTSCWVKSQDSDYSVECHYSSLKPV